MTLFFSVVCPPCRALVRRNPPASRQLPGPCNPDALAISCIKSNLLSCSDGRACSGIQADLFAWRPPPALRWPRGRRTERGEPARGPASLPRCRRPIRGRSGASGLAFPPPAILWPSLHGPGTRRPRLAGGSNSLRATWSVCAAVNVMAINPSVAVPAARRRRRAGPGAGLPRLFPPVCRGHYGLSAYNRHQPPPISAEVIGNHRIAQAPVSTFLSTRGDHHTAPMCFSFRLSRLGAAGVRFLA